MTVLATGAITSRVDAAQRLQEQITAPCPDKHRGLQVSILNASLTEIYQNSDVIITVEEHSIWVGLGLVSSRSALQVYVRR